MFTPGGMGATLSPTSAIFFTTVPANGARITVFGELRPAQRRSACDCDGAAAARVAIGLGLPEGGVGHAHLARAASSVSARQDLVAVRVAR